MLMKKLKIISLIFVFLSSLIFPLTQNIRPASAYANIIYADVDNDGHLEQAQDNDGNSVNGYETFYDPDGSTQVVKSGNFNWDGHTDFFLDTNNDGYPDIYWDPSDGIISKVTITKIENTPKTTLPDWVFSSQGNNINDRYYSQNFKVIRKMAHAIDLSITKTVSDPTPQLGESITYTYIVTNTGTSTAPGVQAANAKYPSQFIYQTSSSSQGVYNQTTGLWAVGNLSANTHAKLTVTVKVPNNLCANYTDATTTVSYTPTSTPIVLPKHADIRDAADASYSGLNAGDTSGMFVSALGDINGDGYNDIYVSGAPSFSSPPTTGYIILGKPTGWQKNVTLSSADIKFYDSRAGYKFLGGWQVPNHIDVNGDGLNDFVFSEIDPSWAGHIFVVTGKTSGWASSYNLASSTDFCAGSFAPENSTDFNGTVTNAGDVNHDGFDDFLVGGSAKGYLVFGRASGWPNQGNLGTASGASFIKEVYNSNLDTQDIGDVNNDGFDDFLLGDADYYKSGGVAYDDTGTGASAYGKVWLIYGKASGWQLNTSLATGSDASFIGEGPDNMLDAGDKIGDINGDGIPDFALAATHDSQAVYHAGKDYIFFGKSSPGWHIDMNVASASDASFLGGVYRDHLAQPRNIGDVNGDGIDDIGFNAYNSTNHLYYDGRVFIVLGKKTGWQKNEDIDTAAVFSAYGSIVSDELEDTAPIGDFNKDGYADIEVDGWGNNAYLVLGRSSGWTKDQNIASSSDASWYGETPITPPAWGLWMIGDNFGDLNGDGYDDMVLNEQQEADQGADTGKVYIVFGRENTSWLIDSNYANNSATAAVRVQCHNLSYTAGANGSLVGTSTQVVASGANGSLITAIPNSGYQFVVWSDNGISNPRHDTDIESDMSVSAIFSPIPQSSGGGAIFAPPAGTGTVTQNETIGMNQTGDLGSINNSGTDYLTYVNSTADFNLPASGSGSQSHQLTINTVDLLTNTIQFTVQSTPQKFSLKLGQTIDVDLNGDKINELEIKFAGIFNNRVELTMRSLLGIPAVEAQTNPISAPSTQSATTNSAPAKYIFFRNLSIGMIGFDVKALQQFLNSHGFTLAKSGPGSPGKETAKFGAATRTALIKYQKANHIAPAVGYFGPLTRKEVNDK
jgi:uncharacterized repeat protein (TIGR01451 family)